MQNNNKLVIFFFHRDICKLADKYNAMVFIDECHGTGFFGPTGRWVHIVNEFKMKSVLWSLVKLSKIQLEEEDSIKVIQQNFVMWTKGKKSFLNKMPYFKMDLQPI